MAYTNKEAAVIEKRCYGLTSNFWLYRFLKVLSYSPFHLI